MQACPKPMRADLVLVSSFPYWKHRVCCTESPLKKTCSNSLIYVGISEWKAARFLS